jgi:hypothetical protein
MTAKLHATDPGHWAELTGMCAGARGLGLGACLYKRGSAEWRRWKRGHGRGRRSVPRETMKRQNPGRGRAKLGPRREWTAIEDSVLLAWWGREPGRETVARLPGRNAQACRNRIHRILRQAQDEGG